MEGTRAKARDYIKRMHYSFRFLIAVFAVWRLTHLLAKEDGPSETLRALRQVLSHGVLGTMFGCFYCLSVWVALPFAWFVGGSWIEIVAVWWALSGAAILLERMTREPAEIKITEGDHGVLWRSGSRTADD
ncbi:MAG TPA: hypothetical protein VE422_09650 [Terriglobia bacterium]|nr:hypothetical protein [Terriglobia bacterium]